jgi:hypothetical protein
VVWRAPFARLRPPLVACPLVARPFAPLVWHPSLALSLCCPLLYSAALFLLFPRPPAAPFLARAAAANVNPRTRLSHMTPFIICDWCTREQYRLMMQKSQNFRQMTPRILRRARDSPRIFPGFSEKVGRRSGLEHTIPNHSPTPPLKLSACSTKAPVTDWRIHRSCGA